MNNVDRDRYPTEVFWSDEDEGFIAIAPDLPGCSAWGDTKIEALTELDAAIAVWIEASIAAGNPIPAPSNPAEEQQFGGKILVRTPRSLHAKLVRGAKRENVSLNQYIVYLLTELDTKNSIEHKLSEIINEAEEKTINYYRLYAGVTSQTIGTFADDRIIKYGTHVHFSGNPEKFLMIPYNTLATLDVEMAHG
jgi:predicted RNase H-like HicB family nuclease